MHLGTCTDPQIHVHSMSFPKACSFAREPCSAQDNEGMHSGRRDPLTCAVQKLQELGGAGLAVRLHLACEPDQAAQHAFNIGSLHAWATQDASYLVLSIQSDKLQA